MSVAAVSGEVCSECFFRGPSEYVENTYSALSIFTFSAVIVGMSISGLLMYALHVAPVFELYMRSLEGASEALLMLLLAVASCILAIIIAIHQIHDEVYGE